MMGKQKCSQCMNSFTMLKLARKLPTCEHSICEPCIKEIIDSRQEMIICGFCSALVRKEEIRLFPLNTAVLLVLSEKPITVTEQPVMNEEENQLMADLMVSPAPSQLDQYQQELCPKHKVVLDIVCISDKQRICPHCALFGPHRDHRFKRLDDFQRELKEKRQVFQEIQTDKQKAFRSELGRLGDQFARRKEMRKGELRMKIDEEFRRYDSELRKRKEQAYHDLDTAFFDLQQQFKVHGSVGQFENVKQKLNQWEQSCLQSLHKLDTTKKVEDKLSYYYEGPLEIVTEGYIYIEELNKYKDEAFKKLADTIGEVKVNFESGKNWFDRCVRVSSGKGKLRTSQIQEMDDECDINPFLDCTSSEIIIGTNSFINNNTSLEVDIASIPSPNKKPSFESNKKILHTQTPTPNRNEIKNVRSIEKERPRLTTTNSPQVKKSLMTSPKSSNSNVSKRPISELGTFRSPSKLLKNVSTIKETPVRSKECSFIERDKDTSTLEAKEPEKIYLQFSKNTLCDFFDISQCNLASEKVVEYVHRARRIHKIRGLKICNNHLTTQGFEKMTEFLQGVSNVNAANNELTEGIFEVIVRNKERLDSLRVLNLAHNPINMERDKKAGVKFEEVKKMGVIVTM